MTSTSRHIRVPGEEFAVHVGAIADRLGLTGSEPDPGACVHVRQVLGRSGEAWSVPVLARLDAGPLRFGELRRALPAVSQRMLTRTVRTLERDGLVRRTVHDSVPPQVEYALTGLGRSLLDPVLALAGWAIDHRADLDANRERYDAR